MHRVVFLKSDGSEAHPAVLLGLPLWGVCVDLGASRAVGELKEAGEHAVVLRSVRKDGVLKVHAMGDDAVVLIHPGENNKVLKEMAVTVLTLERRR